MKTERTLFKISLSETVLFAILLVVTLNAFVLVISLIMWKSYFTLMAKSWIFLVAYPLILPLIQTSINRNGVLKVDGLNDIQTALKKIDFLLIKKGYIAVGQDLTQINYAKKAKFDQFFNFIMKDDICVKTVDQEVQVFGKRNMLLAIEVRLKY